MVLALLSGRLQCLVSYREVAHRLGLSEFMVRRLEQEALRKLRRSLVGAYEVNGWDEP
jgi:DNA-directed RNA polymerase specialized sigma subunit